MAFWLLLKKLMPLNKAIILVSYVESCTQNPLKIIIRRPGV